MSLFGDIVGGLFGLAGGALTNKANRSAAQRANDFTEYQLKNRHQWEVEDLKSAGLNPVLSAGGTPSIGSSAQANVINPMDSALQAASTAIDLKQKKETVELTKNQQEKTMADSSKAWADTELSNALKQTQFEQQLKTRNENELIDLQKNLTAYQSAGAKYDAVNKYYSTFGARNDAHVNQLLYKAGTSAKAIETLGKLGLGAGALGSTIFRNRKLKGN
jgi:hypothetical protein